MKVIIAGSRGITNIKLVEEAIKESKIKIKCVVSGVCPNSPDMLGIEWAKKNNVPWEEYPADWDNLEAKGAVIRTNKFGKKYNCLAGFKRNELMASKSDALICIIKDDSPGSSNMIDIMEKLGKRVYVKYV